MSLCVLQVMKQVGGSVPLDVSLMSVLVSLRAPFVDLEPRSFAFFLVAAFRMRSLLLSVTSLIASATTFLASSTSFVDACRRRWGIDGELADSSEIYDECDPDSFKSGGKAPTAKLSQMLLTAMNNACITKVC